MRPGATAPAPTGSSRPSASESFYIQEGSLAIRSRDYDRAIDSLRMALAQNSDNVEALNLMGMAWFYKKDYRAAESRFALSASLRLK